MRKREQLKQGTRVVQIGRDDVNHILSILIECETERDVYFEQVEVPLRGIYDRSAQEAMRFLVREVSEAVRELVEETVRLEGGDGSSDSGEGGKAVGAD